MIFLQNSFYKTHFITEIMLKIKYNKNTQKIIEKIKIKQSKGRKV